MGYLLDTHTLIWYIEGSPKIPAEILRLIKNGADKKYISSASLWEIAIKMSIKKLKIGMTFDELLILVEDSGLVILHPESEYLKGIFRLENLHKDPFDRLIIATAIAKGLTIITADKDIQKYAASCIW
ncbi:MAG: type II toxin-antitoxin system VapC family toxin [Clostridiales bacterium]|jgi:PIN domain nuclease of toxin-antitoxin system|nr:type II toxin-antitoxin system VapC family toxin [Clostridiales bacterium]